jgi:ribosomal protein L35AE/L33A
MANGTGLQGEYFDNSNFTDPLLTRIDPQIDFNWYGDSPALNVVPADNFYVRWTGQVEARYSETYTFYTYSDDGVRLWVNDQLIINNWTDHAPKEDIGTITLTAGQRYNIRMEYYERRWGAVAQLSWSSSSQTKEIIPTEQLYPNAAPPPENAGTLAFGSATYTVNENGTTAQVTFTRTNGSDGAVSAQVSRTGGTATSGSDFTNVFPASVSFADGETGSKTVSIPIVNDSAVEPNETLTLALGNATGGATLGAQNTATLTIVNDDLPPGGSGSGLTATYFNNMDFTGTTVSRIDPTVDFNWAGGSPDAAIASDTFSARWTGQVEAPVSGTYTFYTYSDDGVRLWVNDQLIINNWTDHAPKEDIGTITLTAGQKYDIRMEYYERGWGAVAQLSWATPGLPKQIIPTAQLYPSEAPPPTNAGTLAFGSATYTVNENGTTAQVTVTRSNGSDGAVSAQVSRTGGTATSGTDFTNVFPALVSFADGETGSKTVSIPIVNDSDVEPNETINLALSNATGGVTLGAQNTATLTIVDNDTINAGTLAFGSAAYTVNENGTTAQVTVTRTNGSDGAVSAQVTRTGGTATSGTDFTNVFPASVSFADGETGSKTVSIPIVNDSDVEPNETLTLALSNTTGGATLGTQNTATLTIVNDDLPPGGSGSGLTATYFNNMDFTGTTVSRIDPTVDFNWGGGSPDAVIASDTFSARWTGQVEAPVSGTYTFYTYSDDGVRLWVNDQLIINNWTDHAPKEDIGTITLTAGQKYDIRMEYYERGWGAVAQLSWAAPGLPKQIIPTAQLYPNASPPPTNAGTLAFGSASYTVNENGITAQVTVTRTNGSDGAVSAQVTRTGGTATSGTDFTNVFPASVSFADGETGSKTVSIPIVNDSAVESDETLNLALGNTTGGATLGAQNTATLTIIDNDTTSPSSDPSAFTYGANEQLLLFTDFTTANGWQLDRMQLVNGELVSQPNAEWTQAIYDLTAFNKLDLDNGDIALYWRARADRSDPEAAKFFVELDVVDKPPDANGNDEDREIKWNIRPVAPSNPNFNNLPYLLYLDPGWQLPHEVEADLQVPDEFPTFTTYENFKLTLSKTGPDTVAVMPYYWANGAWQASQPQSGSALPMELSMANNLEGRDFFDSLTVRFRQDRTAMDAFAITQELSAATASPQLTLVDSFGGDLTELSKVESTIGGSGKELFLATDGSNGPNPSSAEWTWLDAKTYNWQLDWDGDQATFSLFNGPPVPGSLSAVITYDVVDTPINGLELKTRVDSRDSSKVEPGTQALLTLETVNGYNISSQNIQSTATGVAGQDTWNNLYVASNTFLNPFSLTGTATFDWQDLNPQTANAGARLQFQIEANYDPTLGMNLPSAPRLFLDAAQLSETRAAIAVTGSHHQTAFEAIKARVDPLVNLGRPLAQNDLWAYEENLNDGNWNYARAWLAREASFLYLITGNQSYSQLAFDALYAIHDDPDPDGRLPESGYGLARAATGMGFALAYDWAASGWTQAQQDYIRGKIQTSLDAWTTYSHPNFSSPYGSNWVAVCRSAELVMMLAVGEEANPNRSSRFNNLKFWLREHIKAAYGDIGWTQEGQGYLAYAGGFLMPAIYALRSIDDGYLEDTLATVRFEQLPLYAGTFDAAQTSLQFGVSGPGFDAEGWSSFLMDYASPSLQPYYQYFYDHHRGLANPAPDSAKFDHRRAGTVWSVLYYPTETAALDPTGVLPVAIQDSDKGVYLFRNRWQDVNDILLSFMGDFEHGAGWDQSEAFALGLRAYNTHYFGGPIHENGAQYFSRLIVDGKAGNDRLTGAADFFESRSAGGYAIVDGGSSYSDLGA